MAVRYTITRWDSRTAMKAREFIEVSRKDAAHDRLYAVVRRMVEAEGLLDRAVAYRLINEVLACNVSPPPLGSYRLQEFCLLREGGAKGDGTRTAAPDGPYVEFRAHRVE